MARTDGSAAARLCFASALLLSALLSIAVDVHSADTVRPTSADEFFDGLRALCGARFEGASSFPADPGDDFAGKRLVAVIESCTASEIRVPFAVGGDRSRTWIIARVPGGLSLKHDHRHADGRPDEITMYGGTSVDNGTAHSQSFAADAHTARLIPAAATNVWTLSLDPDGRRLTYYLERNAKPRFKATLERVAD